MTVFVVLNFGGLLMVVIGSGTAIYWMFAGHMGLHMVNDSVKK